MGHISKMMQAGRRRLTLIITLPSGCIYARTHCSRDSDKQTFSPRNRVEKAFVTLIVGGCAFPQEYTFMGYLYLKPRNNGNGKKTC